MIKSVAKTLVKQYSICGNLQTRCFQKVAFPENLGNPWKFMMESVAKTMVKQDPNCEIPGKGLFENSVFWNARGATMRC